MAQQTAVEWLIKQINGQSFNKVTIAIPKKVIEQAKEMEKEQMMQSYEQGYMRVAKLIEDTTQINLNL